MISNNSTPSSAGSLNPFYLVRLTRLVIVDSYLSELIPDEKHHPSHIYLIEDAVWKFMLWSSGYILRLHCSITSYGYIARCIGESCEEGVETNLSPTTTLSGQVLY
jgi:hypothetical protein